MPRPFHTRLLASLMLASALLGGCQKAPAVPGASVAVDGVVASAASRSRALESWRDEAIYFVLTDRFHNGDKRNDFNVDPKDPNAYHGGDLAGLIQKLDYIKDLGATAIWLTPINDNRDDALVGKYWGFHGYWIKDFNKVDEHLGDEALFKQLVSQAHARGLKVMLDMVVNHTGYDAPMAKDPAKVDWFHHNGDIKNYDDAYQLENFDLAGLPDFNTEHPAVQAYMADVWGGWVARTGIDAMRMDTVKHVGMGFWPRFNQAIASKAPAGFLKLGEVLHGDAGFVGRYTREGKFDSVFDFPMYYTITDVFAHGQSMRKLGERLSQDGAYADANLISPFLDNHDTPRFMSQAGNDERKLRLALAFLTTMRGIPTIYQGTEIGQSGASEADNRRDMAFGANPSLTSYTRKLLHLRQELTPLRRGRMLEMWQDDQVYGYSRLMDNGDEVIVFLNNSTGKANRSVPLRAESGLKDGTTLTNRLADGSLTVANRHLAVELGPKEAQIFVVSARKPPAKPQPRR